MGNINIGWTVPSVWEGWGNDNNYLFLDKYSEFSIFHRNKNT